jgi:hypothetical protein
VIPWFGDTASGKENVPRGFENMLPKIIFGHRTVEEQEAGANKGGAS